MTTVVCSRFTNPISDRWVDSKNNIFAEDYIKIYEWSYLLLKTSNSL